MEYLIPTKKRYTQYSVATLNDLYEIVQRVTIDVCTSITKNINKTTE